MLPVTSRWGNSAPSWRDVPDPAPLGGDHHLFAAVSTLPPTSIASRWAERIRRVPRSNVVLTASGGDRGTAVGAARSAPSGRPDREPGDRRTRRSDR